VIEQVQDIDVVLARAEAIKRKVDAVERERDRLLTPYAPRGAALFCVRCHRLSPILFGEPGRELCADCSGDETVETVAMASCPTCGASEAVTVESLGLAAALSYMADQEAALVVAEKGLAEALIAKSKVGSADAMEGGEDDDD
jgi:hypothetical protein